MCLVKVVKLGKYVEFSGGQQEHCQLQTNLYDLTT